MLAHAAPTWAEAIDLVQAIIWPVAVVVVVVVLAVTERGRTLVERVSGRVRRVSALGVELELTAEAATRIKADLEETFRAYRSAIVSEFNRQASILHIPELRRRVVEEAVVPNLADRPGAMRPSYRCTIHVRDILLNEAMYQLLDYYPAAGSGGAGRTFSMRFGIVGQAWRTGESKLKEDIQPGDSYVVTDWGMLPEEAAAAGYGKRSFAGVVLQHNGVTVGVLYLDSPEEDAFDGAITVAVERAAEVTGLTSALAELERTMRARGPSLTVFDA
jgi:hypothetical protein